MNFLTLCRRAQTNVMGYKPWAIHFAKNVCRKYIMLKAYYFGNKQFDTSLEYPVCANLHNVFYMTWQIIFQIFHFKLVIDQSLLQELNAKCWTCLRNTLPHNKNKSSPNLQLHTDGVLILWVRKIQFRLKKKTTHTLKCKIWNVAEIWLF